MTHVAHAIVTLRDRATRLRSNAPDPLSGIRLMCSPVLAAGGEVHLALKLGPPYSEWGVEGLASEAGYVLMDTLPFDAAAFPGYQHVTTERGAAQLDTRSAGARKLLKTLVFRRRRARPWRGECGAE